ncbi:class I SAM-dependent methyltransferase [Ruminococcaceae bacterium OttesenSCG-928-D13]|nr:class I SAM-dependent methyltransferase [Ruminococcaceae bacterium OttesenSCG-928-D13]
MNGPDQGEMYRAGRPALGARLLAAVEAVRPGRKVADIGCDHGKLAVWLALAGAPLVTAVDSRPMPLEKAKALVRQCGLEGKVRCLLGNGLGPVAPEDAEDIVIAGLGGEVTAGILSAAPWLRDARFRLVLVPTSRHPHLRRWLSESGFALLGETPVLEKGRPYTVMRAAFTGEAAVPTGLFCQVGLVPRAFEDGDEKTKKAAGAYLNARLAALEKAGRAPMDPPARAAHESLVKELEACLL